MPAQGRRFHLEQRIGAGAYGEVFLAELSSTAGFKKRVAVKLLHPHHADSEEAGRRLRDEARILGRLSHRHIVTVLDLVRLDNRWALVMDYVPGADLERVIDGLHAASERFPPAAALEIGAAVARALDAAFTTDDGRGGNLAVIHRDVKPSNIRLTADGDVKVLDFGVARADVEGREASTGLYRTGTERYMAPERILGGKESPAGDVYSLAATIAELLLMRPIGRTPCLPEEHRAFVTETAEALRVRLANDGFTAEDVVSTMIDALDADPIARPSARELASRWQALARHAGEDLASFASRAVPAVRERLGDHTEPVDAVLSEHSFGTLVPPAEELAGYLPGEALSEEAAAPVVFRPDRRTGRAWVLAPLLVLLAAGAWWTQQAPEPEPAPVAATSEVASIVAVEPARAAAPEVVPPPKPTPAPASVARPRPAPRPAPAIRPAPAPIPSPTPAQVDRAMFVAPDASALTVTCGDVVGSGTTGVRLRRFPAGECTVSAMVLGKQREVAVEVDAVSEVRCELAGEVLACG
ncbi:MAG: serine/threonine protein kinase [Deltaproteobacteria bacterium]|nr:MAG: serine/threonine protein kinase [Deltaproteobacteria bacterium]